MLAQRAIVVAGFFLVNKYSGIQLEHYQKTLRDSLPDVWSDDKKRDSLAKFKDSEHDMPIDEVCIVN